MIAYPNIFITTLPPKHHEHSTRYPYFTVGISQSKKITQGGGEGNTPSPVNRWEIGIKAAIFSEYGISGVEEIHAACLKANLPEMPINSFDSLASASTGLPIWQVLHDYPLLLYFSNAAINSALADCRGCLVCIKPRSK